MSKKILITSALPYANGPLHFGHIAGSYLPADCYARYQRLKGSRVLYICGSDEYGVAITLTAEMAGRTPKEHVDIFHEVNKAFFKQLNISFDHYSRTTWPGHKLTTVEFFNDLLKNGYIERQETEQLYSERDHRFLADRYVLGTCPKCGFQEARGDECQRCGGNYEATDLKNPRSKLTGSPLVLKPTQHWFLRFDRFKESLKEWLKTKKWKANVLNFAEHYAEELRPRAITRDSQWGIPVPLDEAKGKVFYVWFDAPIGYISATREWAELKGEPEAWKEYWLDPEVKLVQFLGKDNIPFHALFFPAMTMGQNQPYKLVDELPANEFYNLEGRQFSKSEGWTIDLDAFFKQFTSDQIRYTIAANAPESQDSEFTWRDFQSRCNAELLGKYGNLVNRTLTFMQAQCGGVIPNPTAFEEVDREFLSKVNLLAAEIAASYEQFHLRRAASLVMELAQTANVYFDSRKPWALAKKEETRPEMERTLYCCLEAIKTLALVSSPIIPTSADKVWKMLGFVHPLEKQSWNEVLKTELQPGQKLPVPSILFTRVEDEPIQVEIEKLKALVDKKENMITHTPLKESISIDEFRKIDLRVGQILAVERVPKSKKLLKFTIDLGFEQRTVLSGIGEGLDDIQFYIGKKVLLVANLKPAQIMGIESQGMLLVADLPESFELPAFGPNVPPGSALS